MTLEERLRSWFPWGIGIGLRSVALTIACGGGLVATRVGVAGGDELDEQVTWLSVGIVTLLIAMYGHTSLIIRGRRAIGDRRARLIDDALVELEPSLARLVANDGAMGQSPALDRDQDQVLVGDSLTLYHSAGCPMAAGRDTRVVHTSVAEQRGLEPCGVCR